MSEIRKKPDHGEDIVIAPRKSYTRKEREEIWKAAKRIGAGKVLCGCGCGEEIQEGDKWHAGHDRSRGLGGANDIGNICPWTPRCNLKRAWEEEIPAIAKAKRIERKRKGLVKPKKKIASRGFPPRGSRKLQWWKD